MARFDLVNNLSYQGACKMPSMPWSQSDPNRNFSYVFSWGRACLHINDDSSFWHSANGTDRYIARLTLPSTLSYSRDYSSLPVCAVHEWHRVSGALNCRNPDGTVVGNGSKAAGIAPYDSRYRVSIEKTNYAESSYAFIGLDPIDGVSAVLGPWYLSGVHQNQGGSALLKMPPWLSEITGKTYLSGCFGGSIVGSGNQGPSAYAFDIDETLPAGGTIQDTVKLIEYKNPGMPKTWTGEFQGAAAVTTATGLVNEGGIAALKSGSRECLAFGGTWIQSTMHDGGDLRYKSTVRTISSCTFDPATNTVVFNNTSPNLRVGNGDIVNFRVDSGTIPSWLPGSGYTYIFWVHNATPTSCQIQRAFSPTGVQQPYNPADIIAITSAGNGTYSIQYPTGSVYEDGTFCHSGGWTPDYATTGIYAFSISDIKAVIAGQLPANRIMPYQWFFPHEHLITNLSANQSCAGIDGYRITMAASDSMLLVTESATLPIIHVYNII